MDRQGHDGSLWLAGADAGASPMTLVAPFPTELLAQAICAVIPALKSWFMLWPWRRSSGLPPPMPVP